MIVLLVWTKGNKDQLININEVQITGGMLPTKINCNFGRGK